HTNNSCGPVAPRSSHKGRNSTKVAGWAVLGWAGLCWVGLDWALSSVLQPIVDAVEGFLAQSLGHAGTVERRSSQGGQLGVGETLVGAQRLVLRRETRAE